MCRLFSKKKEEPFFPTVMEELKAKNEEALRYLRGQNIDRRKTLKYDPRPSPFTTDSPKKGK